MPLPFPLHSNTTKIRIAIRSQRTIKSAFDLVAALGDGLLRYSASGFDDWLPADEQTEELLRLYQQDYEDENLPLDEGFSEFNEEDVDAGATRQIEQLQIIKNTISKIGKTSSRMPKEELNKLRVAYEKVFVENVNVKQLSFAFDHSV